MFFRKRGSQSNHEDDHAEKELKIAELKAAIGPLFGRDQIYCSEACFRRYLVARNWNVEKARKMLTDSLEWRAIYKPEDIRWPDVAKEGETGKLYRANFRDREGQTVLVMTPAKQNTNSGDGQIRQLVYMMENTIINLPEGREQLVWLVDYAGWTLAHATPLKTVREIAHIMQNHYPERLGCILQFNAPRVFEAFYKAAKVFVDPKTRQKIHFVYSENEESVKVMHRFFDPNVLPVQFGGKNEVVYDHQAYSAIMLEDDIKTEKFWSSHEAPERQGHATNGRAIAGATKGHTLAEGSE